MKSCMKKVSQGDVVIWQMPHNETIRYLICEQPEHRTDYFLAECKEWTAADTAWERTSSPGTFAFDKIVAVEKAKKRG